MGILGGGFYFHNISLPVIKGNANPENNSRDVFIGYFLVFLTYAFAGVLGYYGFTGETFEQDSPSTLGIEQNCSVMFSTSSIMGTLMRLFAFFQLLTVNSLLFACERSQILLLATGKQTASSDRANLMLNGALIFPSFVLAIYYPQVGTVAGLCGAFATMFCIYILPCATYLKYTWT